MYNRYIPDGACYIKIPEEPEPAPPKGKPEPEPPPRAEQHGGLGALGSLLEQTPFSQLLKKGGEQSGLNGILKALHLEDLDTGDILLLLILLFLFLEGDNIELVITLGLILLLGLGDGKEDQPT